MRLLLLFLISLFIYAASAKVNGRRQLFKRADSGEKKDSHGISAPYICPNGTGSHSKEGSKAGSKEKPKPGSKEQTIVDCFEAEPAAGIPSGNEYITFNIPPAILKFLQSTNLSTYGSYVNGTWQWNPSVNFYNWAKIIQDGVGYSVPFWSHVIYYYPNIFFSDGNNKVNFQIPYSALLQLSNLTDYGQFVNNQWQWNPNFNDYQWANNLRNQFGNSIDFWRFVFDYLTNADRNTSIVTSATWKMPLNSSSEGDSEILITIPSQAIQSFLQLNVTSFQDISKDNVAWKKGANFTAWANYLQKQFGATPDFWYFLISNYPQIFSSQFNQSANAYVELDVPNAALNQIQQAYLANGPGPWKTDTTSLTQNLQKAFKNTPAYWQFIVSMFPTFYSSISKDNTVPIPPSGTPPQMNNVIVTIPYSVIKELQQSGINIFLQNISGILVWSKDLDLTQWAQKFQKQFGQSVAFWEYLIILYPQLFAPNSSEYVNPQIYSPDSYIIDGNDGVEIVSKIPAVGVDQLNKLNLTQFGSFDSNGNWIWKPNFNIDQFVDTLHSDNGDPYMLWNYIVNSVSNLVPPTSLNNQSIIEIRLTPVTTTPVLNGTSTPPTKPPHTQFTTVNISIPWQVIQFILQQTNLTSYLQNNNGTLVWSNDLDKNYWANYLQNHFGQTVSFWYYIMTNYPEMFVQNSQPRDFFISIEIPLTINDIQQLGQFNNGVWTWDPQFNRTQAIQKFKNEYGNSNAFWQFVISIIPELNQPTIIVLPNTGNSVETSPTSVIPTVPTVNNENASIIITVPAQAISDIIRNFNISSYLTNDNGTWSWNNNFNSSFWAQILAQQLGQTVPFWQYFLTTYPQLFSPNSQMISNNTITLVIPVPRSAVTQLLQLNLTSDGHYQDGVWVWNPNFNITNLATNLQNQFGNSYVFWVYIINSFPSFITSFQNNSQPTANIPYTLHGISNITVVIPYQVINSIKQSELVNSLQNINNSWVWSDDVNLTQWADIIENQLGGPSSSFWEYVLKNYPQYFSPNSQSGNVTITFTFPTPVFDTLSRYNLTNNGQMINNVWQWNPQFRPNITQLIQVLQNQFNGSSLFWRVIIDSMPYFYSDNFTVFSIPFKTGSIQLNNSTFQINVILPAQVLAYLRQANLESYIENVNGHLVWNDTLNLTSVAQNLQNQFGQSIPFWVFILTNFPQILFLNTTGNVNATFTIPTSVINDLKNANLSTQGHYVGGNWVWNPDFDLNKLTSNLQNQYGYSQLFWQFIITTFPNLFVGDFDNNSTTLTIPIPSVSNGNDNGAKINVTAVIPNEIISRIHTDLSPYLQNINGSISWNNDVNLTQRAETYQSEFGETVPFWLYIITTFPQAFLANVTSAGSVNFTSTFPVSVINTLINSNLSKQGQYINDTWVWNPGFDANQWLQTIQNQYGFAVLFLQYIITSFPDIFLSNATQGFITVPVPPKTEVDITIPSQIVSQLQQTNLSTSLQNQNGSLVWNSNVNLTQWAQTFQTKFGNSLQFWLFILTNYPQIFTNITGGDMTLSFQSPASAIDALDQADLTYLGRYFNGKFVWVPNFNLTQVAEQFQKQYGNTLSYWEFLINSFPTINRQVFNANGTVIIPALYSNK